MIRCSCQKSKSIFFFFGFVNWLLEKSACLNNSIDDNSHVLFIETKSCAKRVTWIIPSSLPDRPTT